MLIALVEVMTLFEDGRVVDIFLISSGKPGMDTPAGQYAIYNKHPRRWSRQYESFMPFWMANTSDGKYGIHELPEWPGELGRRVSIWVFRFLMVVCVLVWGLRVSCMVGLI